MPDSFISVHLILVKDHVYVPGTLKIFIILDPLHDLFESHELLEILLMWSSLTRKPCSDQGCLWTLDASLVGFSLSSSMSKYSSLCFICLFSHSCLSTMSLRASLIGKTLGLIHAYLPYISFTFEQFSTLLNPVVGFLMLFIWECCYFNSLFVLSIDSFIPFRRMLMINSKMCLFLSWKLYQIKVCIYILFDWCTY